jgi:thiosulfate dehydrogenase (quinone) large subunit
MRVFASFKTQLQSSSEKANVNCSSIFSNKFFPTSNNKSELENHHLGGFICMSYIEKLKDEFRNPITALLVLAFTVARVIYGWAWVQSGLGKLAWISNNKPDAAGKIATMIKNIAGPEVTRFDPLYINKLWGWFAQNVVLSLPELTDTLVVLIEIGAGILIILGLRVFWAALIMTFMNLQFFAGGSFNNFGYIWTNLLLMGFNKHAELIGLDGLLRSRRHNRLIPTRRTS